MAKRKAEEVEQAPASSKPKSARTSRTARAPYTEQQRLEAATARGEWIAKLMELSDVDSNKQGGSKSFLDLKSKVLSLAPESFRERIRWMPFKGNTRSVHRAACDKIIEEVMKDTEPADSPPAAAAPAAPEAPAAPAPEVKRRPNTRPPSTASGRDTQRPKQPGLERFFTSATALAGAAERPTSTTSPSSPRPAERSKQGQCHYSKLGIAEVSTLAQIIKAYRQMALKTHPDKGGTDKEFQEVKAAFDILSCAEKRARYDASRFGREHRVDDPHNTPCESEEQPCEVEEVAKSMLVALLMRRLPKETLSHVDLPSLLKIHGLLQLMRERMKGQPKEGLRNDLSEKSGTGLTRKRNGEYQVDVSWRCFRVRADHIASLDHATELHCALVRLREGAQARIKKALAMRGRCSEREVLLEEPPLTEEELMQMKVPWMLQFASDLRSKWQDDEEVHEENQEKPKLGKDDRWMTPYTPKLSTAYQFRRQLRQSLGLKKEMASRQHDKTIQSELAKEETKDFLQLQEELVALAARELVSRGENEPREGRRPGLAQALQTINNQAMVRNQLMGKYERLQDRHCELRQSLSVCEEEKALLQLCNQELATRCKKYKQLEQDRIRIENTEKRNAAEKKKEKAAAISGGARHFLQRD